MQYPVRRDRTGKMLWGVKWNHAEKVYQSGIDAECVRRGEQPIYAPWLNS